MRRALILFPFFVAAWAVAVVALQSSPVAAPLAPNDNPTDTPLKLIAEKFAGHSAVADWSDDHDHISGLDVCIDGFRGVCFAPGTTDDYMMQIGAVLRAKWEEQIAQNGEGIAYNVSNGWSSQGTPIALTWSLVPDGISIPGGIGEPTANSTLFSTMDAKFGAANRATWILRIQQSLDRWGELSGLSFTRVTTGGNDWDDGAAWGTNGSAGLRGDLRFSCHPIDGTNNVLAYSDFPPGGDVVLDSGEQWQNSTNLHRFMRNIIMHESGHSIGMFHVCPANGTKLMEPQLVTTFDGPRHDDIRAAHRLYGDNDEPNDNSGAATDLGTLTAGGTLNRGTLPNPVSGTNPANTSSISIDSTSDSDWFKFAITGSRTISVTVTPVGTGYDSSTQAGNGSCNSGNIIDSTAVGNLGVELINTNGSSILASANANPAGSAETIAAFSLVNVGTYYVRVFGTAVSQTQMYTLAISATATCVGPSFTQHPSNMSVCAGNPVTFNVTVDGSSPLNYQWKKNTVDIPGATSEDYTIAAVLPGDVGSYTCFVSNACGNATSNAATLTVNSQPSIDTQPTNQVACTGTNATFTVAASGGTLSYQWRKAGSDISGATSSSYTITGVNTGNAGSYDCVVTNGCGSVTTNSVSLTVRTPPVIINQPIGDSGCIGDVLLIDISAGGTGPLSYQWRKAGNNVAGATSSTLELTIAANSGGSYDCVVTNACGSVMSNSFTVTVLAATTIGTQPTNQSACVGGSVSFTVGATGQSPLTYQWKKGGNNVSGATSPTLTINPVGAGDAGNYSCLVTGGCGSVTSDVATLTLGSSASISQQPGNQSVCVGGSASFTVVASNATGYQWRKGGNNIAGATSATLTINPVTGSDVGSYDVVVSGSCGNATSDSASLSIGSGPSFSINPQSGVACQNSPLTLTASASGSPTYQWRKGGAPISGATNSSYTIASVAPGDAGSYDVVATTGCGSTPSSAAVISVQLKGDANCDGFVNNFDIDPFVLAILQGQAVWEATYHCNFACANDVSRDGLVNNFDIDPFVNCVLSGSCP